MPLYDVAYSPTTWQTFTPATQGISGESIVHCRYCMVGLLVHVLYWVQGTSTATTKKFNLPFPSAYEMVCGAGFCTDNGSNLTTPCIFVPGFSGNNAVCDIVKDG